MLTIDILKNPPFSLNEQESLDFMDLSKRFGITLDAFLAGAEYSKTPYTPEQQINIQQELQNIFAITFAGKVPSHDKTYTATAGAPGVGKSVFLEQLIAKNPDLQNAVYVDPDRQSLRLMQCYKQMSEDLGGKAAYEMYRDASNYICNLLMVWAIYKGYSIVHGTTSTNERVAKTILPELKCEEYKIDMHVLFADAESRRESLLRRIEVQDFYQVTQADAKGKVAPVYDRLSDAYLKYADTVTIYYNTNEFWLCSNAIESQECLQQFATFDRSKDLTQVVVVPGSEVFIDKLIAEVYTEVSSEEKQELIIAMFKSWTKNPSNDYIPAFVKLLENKSPDNGDAIRPPPKLDLP